MHNNIDETMRRYEAMERDYRHDMFLRFETEKNRRKVLENEQRRKNRRRREEKESI